MNIEYTVTEATKAQWDEILGERQILNRLCPSWEGKIPTYDKDAKLLTFGKYRMLFTTKPVGNKGIYDIHIAIPKASIKASRVLALLGLKWGFSGGIPNAQVFTTTMPEGKISNFAKKVGWRKAHILGKPLYVIYKQDLIK